MRNESREFVVLNVAYDNGELSLLYANEVYRDWRQPAVEKELRIKMPARPERIRTGDRLYLYGAPGAPYRARIHGRNLFYRRFAHLRYWAGTHNDDLIMFAAAFGLALICFGIAWLFGGK